MPFVLANTAFNYSTRQKQQQPHQQQYQQAPHHHADLSYELYITPHYARGIVAVIEHYNWKDFWYLYNNDEGKINIPLTPAVRKRWSTRELKKIKYANFHT